ncbi:Hsp20/alpha crystallin family protein [Leifsonia sp. C5G2]|uniref:Hsp20/alpha crystallin family protein n=1 Tax=Leifsonia sp. C5G2 TaxID=2735269 RepID=UPI00158560EE|nr:Hsp20/alpha crystallin family protein [Leifsonia sp. C5G2]NUU07250.1 Hsp20/alpha crystallin family protein [Leifsonia sp. C5G2]
MTDELLRLDPFARLARLERDMFSNEWEPRMRVSMPVTDIYTTDDDTMIAEVHLPDFAEGDISVDLDAGDLVIRAEKHEKKEDHGKNYVVRESSRSFYRRIALPEKADPEKATASMGNGVLTVTVPLDGSGRRTRIPISVKAKD